MPVQEMRASSAIDRVAYDYKLANKGPRTLSLQASVALPDLEINNDEAVYYVLPRTDPENVVGLQVQSNGKIVPTRPYLQAFALGIDRLADLKADNIPLIPFSEETEKALAAAKPDTLAKLDSLGLVVPHDAAQPGATIEADWSLHVLHAWMQPLEPAKSTSVTVSFAPVAAVYQIDASSLGGLDSLADQVCVTSQVRAAVAALVKDKGAVANVGDIVLATDGPARFLPSPRATIAVHKPSPTAIVVFCGMDASTQGAAIVRGTVPEDQDASSLRILIFDRDR